MYAHARAPVRIGLAGGGTDLPAWTSKREGRCLSLAIKAYTHAVAITRPDGRVVASYRQRDDASSATEIANGLIRESALQHDWERGFEIHTISELPSHGSGLGVSSSIAVSLTACFRQLSSLRDRQKTKVEVSDFRYRMIGDEVIPVADGDQFAWKENPEFRQSIAREAWGVEINKLRRSIGRQDHMAATHGGLRLYHFAADEASIVRSFSPEDAQWVAENIVLVKLPEGHDAPSILSAVKDQSALEWAWNAVPFAIDAIEKRDVSLLGRAFNYGQHSKELIVGAVPQWLRDLIQRIEHIDGVQAVKVAGAGGGGHLIVACRRSLASAIEITTNLQTMTVEPDLTGVRSDGWK